MIFGFFFLLAYNSVRCDRTTVVTEQCVWQVLLRDCDALHNIEDGTRDHHVRFLGDRHNKCFEFRVVEEPMV